jgi:ATPase subunit of ABC transporter with duplicated ATPase domains
VVLASHDRYFLDHTITRIAELVDGRLEEYLGSYSAFRAPRARELAAQEAAYARHQAEVARLREFVRRQLQRSAEIGAGPKRGRDHYGRVARKVARGALAGKKRLVRLEAAAPDPPRRVDNVFVPFEGRSAQDRRWPISGM